MKKVLKLVGIVLGGLLLVLVLAVIGLSVSANSRLNKTHDVTAENITIPTDAETIARGEHLVNVFCRDCHTAELTGDTLLEDPAIGTIYTANVTGMAVTHSDEEIVRAIRHGIDSDGRQLIIMPSNIFNQLSESDTAAIVAYLKTVPRSGEDQPPTQLALMGRVLLSAGMFGDVFPAEYIDHDQPFPAMPEIGANAAYGEYLAPFCTECHGDNLAGGPAFDAESIAPPNLTPAGELGSWTQEDFITAMRTGVTPTGRQLDPEQMPWESVANFDDDELIGLWLYLSSLPPTETES
jgi:mono/diheme cytochrome c family protein